MPAVRVSIATRIGQVAQEIGARTGLDVEVFDEAALLELGCGGLLGVNAGSTEPATMVKLSYRPDGDARGHLGLVGKGVMYDSGGIALKPADVSLAPRRLHPADRTVGHWLSSPTLTAIATP